MKRLLSLMALLLSCTSVNCSDTSLLNTVPAVPLTQSQKIEKKPDYSDIKLPLLVNQNNPIGKDYKPNNLIVPNIKLASSGAIQKNHVQEQVAYKLEELFKDATNNGITLIGVSGYRDYNRQATLYNNAISRYGKNQKSSAKPGTSEHQTGLAIDVGCPSNTQLTQGFGETKEGKWLAENAHKHGFVVRYPKGKEEITGYIYEPWHIRYVGEEYATYLYENNLTLEELYHQFTSYTGLTVEQVKGGV